MCDLFAISTAFSIATGVMDIVGQSQQAAQVSAYRDAESRAATVAMTDTYAQLGLTRQQEAQAASEKIAEVRREGAKARATARVSAGESNVSGLSVTALQRDLMAQELNYITSVQGNYKRRSDQLTEEAKGVRNQTQSYLNNLPVPQQPDFFGAFARTGAGIADAYYKYKYIPKTTTAG